MTRRSLFKTLTAAIVASSIEVMGWGAGECAAKLNYEELYSEKMYREATFDMSGYDKVKPSPHDVDWSWVPDAINRCQRIPSKFSVN